MLNPPLEEDGLPADYDGTSAHEEEGHVEPVDTNGKVTDSKAFLRVPELDTDEATFEWKQVLLRSIASICS